MPIKILMPALSPTMTEGNLVKWVKKEGDTVEAGEVLAEIETDKATMEVEAVDEGILGKIVVAEGTEGVAVNEVIALLLEEGEDQASLEEFIIEAPAQVKTEEIAKAQPVKEAAVAQLTGTDIGRTFASPLAKRIAQQSGVELTLIKGSGPRGRVVKSDVEAALTTVAPKPTAIRAEGLPEYTEIPLSGMRKIIAQRLTESKQNIPHFYLTVECEVNDLLDLRKQLNDSLDEGKVSVNDMIIKACAQTLMKVPEANSSWAGDHIRRYKAADVSVAVAIEDGLVTPIIRNANLKGIIDIAKETKDIIERARDGKLQPEEYLGGTFCISNMGMMGVKDFAAVINPPQGCIISIGAAEDRVVVHDSKLVIRNVMNCTLSVDHRVVDGAVGAKFLEEFKKLITNPILIVI